MTESRTVERFHTRSRRTAYEFWTAKNKFQKKWNVAAKIKNRLIFDIDDDDTENLLNVRGYYEKLTGMNLTPYKTMHGYHLISEKYTDMIQREYDVCRVLYPLLQKSEIQEYQEKIGRWYSKQSEKQRVIGMPRQEFLDYLPKEFAKSGLDLHYGNFDILFALNVLMKGYYCIRISKKNINDKPYEVKI